MLSMMAPDVTEVLLDPEVPGDAGVPVEVLDGVPGDPGVPGDTSLQEGTAAAADGSALTLGNGGGRRLFCKTKEKMRILANLNSHLIDRISYGYEI